VDFRFRKQRQREHCSGLRRFPVICRSAYRHTPASAEVRREPPEPLEPIGSQAQSLTRQEKKLFEKISVDDSITALLYH
jgi:hypothetical protein